MNVYAKLYDVVAENMQNANIKFRYEKTTFLGDINHSPKVIDVSKYLELENTAFFQAVFVVAFKRLPEEKEVARWLALMKKSKGDFQKAFLKYVSNASVVAINHIELINNPYFVQKKGLKYRTLSVLYGLTDKSSLRQLGKKLPMPVQKIIRKVFL